MLRGWGIYLRYVELEEMGICKAGLYRLVDEVIDVYEGKALFGR